MSFARINQCYEDGCQHRDSENAEKAKESFIKSASFEGYYALGEMYQHGIGGCNKNAETAAQYFICAYDCIKNENKLQHVARIGNDEPNLPAHQQMTSNIIHGLLNQARRGNPISLFLLAGFYQDELNCYDNENERKIQATKTQLTIWMKSCLKAAANLYHPHAAYRLVCEFANELSSDEKLRYSLIAADSQRAIEVLGRHTISLITLRGNRALAEVLFLNLPSINHLPEALYKQIAMNSGHVSGIFHNSASSRSSMILPAKHEDYISGLGNMLGSMTITNKAEEKSASASNQLSQEEMRKMRLLRFSANPNQIDKKETVAAPQEPVSNFHYAK